MTTMMNTDIQLELIYALGFYIDKYEVIRYESSNELVFINGKYLYYGKGSYVGPGYMIFSPIKSKIQIKSLFNYFLNKIYVENGIYTSVYYSHKQGNCYQVVFKTESNTLYSDFYKNENLCYIDIIFRIGGCIINLSQYDI